MGSFTEIELDLSHLDDLEEIIVHDECGGDDVSFYREGLLASDNAKLRKAVSGMYGLLELYDKITGSNFACETKRPMIFGEDKSFKDVMRELGFEVS